MRHYLPALVFFLFVGTAICGGALIARAARVDQVASERDRLINGPPCSAVMNVGDEVRFYPKGCTWRLPQATP